jgi:hypothetical protein
MAPLMIVIQWLAKLPPCDIARVQSVMAYKSLIAFDALYGPGLTQAIEDPAFVIPGQFEPPLTVNTRVSLVGKGVSA